MKTFQRQPFWLLFVQLRLLTVSSTTEQVPKFTSSFPLYYDFSNATGGKLSCTANGQPKPNIIWLMVDGSPVTHVPRLRQVMPDGTLLFPSFGPDDYRQDVHGVSYRCAATNTLGSIVSNEIKVRGVVNQAFDVHVYDVFAMKGDTAAMRCHIPKFLLPYVNVSAWIKDSVVSITSSDMNSNSKYILLPSGELIIRDVDGNDALTTYRCQVFNRLTGELKSNSNPGRLIVTESQGKVPPKIIFSNSNVMVMKNEKAFLPCVANGHPPPNYAWSKQTAYGKFKDIHENYRVKIFSGSLVIETTQESDSGTYMCTATNEVNSKKAIMQLTVSEPLSAVMNPSEATVDANQAIIISCKVSGTPIHTITWLKDGEGLPKDDIFQMNNESIHISKMSIELAGIYQCFATNEQYSTFGVALIKLGDTIPIIIKGFEEQTFFPGNSMLLECTAQGNPIPKIQWSLDNLDVATHGRLFINMRIEGNDKIISTLRIHGLRVEDGGIYRCIAKTNKGYVEHSARIKVNGKLGTRPNVKYQAIEGGLVQIDCPVYGYPIKKIQWEKDGQSLPFDIRHSNPTNGSLLIRNVKRHSDKGKYVCIATGENKEKVKGAIELTVVVSPKITPFSFQDELIREGARARVQCVVREGDNPLKITWFKNGQPLSKEQEINIHDLDEFSSILMISSISPRHNGNYTCEASNPAGIARHTATLFINVAPKINPFSFPENVFEGRSFIRVSCVVYQGDLPIKFHWLKNNVPLLSKNNLIIRTIDDYSSILTIENVEKEHAGNYTCVASNPAASISYSSQLSIHVPLRWIIEPQDTVIKSGQKLFVHCQAEGFPEPLIIWKKSTDNYVLVDEPEILQNNGRIHVFSNGTLMFKKIQRSDGGLYVCFASNNMEQSLGKVISIEVQAAPDFNERRQEFRSNRGDDVEIPCEASGNWPISYTWSIDNQIIDMHNTRYKIEEKQEEANLRSTSVLRINWVDQKDSRDFICTAKNDIGESQLDIRLIVQENPDPPIIETPIKIDGQTIKLSWTLSYDGNNEVIRYIIHYKKDVDRWDTKTTIVTTPGMTTTTSISNLKPATLYNFRVMAENTIGNGTFSEVANGKTDETVPEGAPENVEVESIDANTLRVTWKPPKKHLWNGAIRGYNIGYKIHDSLDEYTFTTLEVPEDYTEELIYQLIDLHMYTQYDVIVKAYNSKGKGPASDMILAMTSEDVPSSAPAEVRCSSLSSKSIYVLWDPPAPDTVNGILRGYKVMYKTTEEWYDAMIQSKIVDTTRVTINNLNVNTNYSLQVLAFTKMGDGVKSTSVFCKTHEDVPDPPETIKVLPSSSDSVVVAWKPPPRSNGALTKYNVYYKQIEDNQKVDIHTQKTEELHHDASIHSSATNKQSVEIKGLKKNQKYAFWVTANSVIGESSESSIVAQTVADSIVPAKAASFDTIIKVPWQENIVLPCTAVGVPSPNRKWTVGDHFLKESNRVKITPDGSVFINKVASEDSGNYTCAVYNEHGRDEVSYIVAVQVPPPAPILDVVSKTRTSIKLQWKLAISGGKSIRGYLIHYKENKGIWSTKEIRAEQVLYTLDNLLCGATYQLYMEAFNNIGTGSPSDTITVTTEGSDVIAPSKDQIIREGSTFVTVQLEAWPKSGCPVKTFSAEYKSVTGREWTVAGSNIRPTQKKIVISDLSPATWYMLRLSVESSSKPILAEYRFATHTATGGTLAPDTFEESLAPVYIFYLDPLIFIPAVALLVMVIIASVVICIYFKRRNGSLGTPSDISDGAKHRGVNTWIRHSHTIPRRRFSRGHSSPHSSPSRKSADPSPYATAHLTDFQPEHGKSRPVAIPLFHNEPFQQAGHSQFAPMSAPSTDTKFVFPSNPHFHEKKMAIGGQGIDDYDPPPIAHMIRNSDN